MVLARIVRLALPVLAALAGVWIGVYAGFWMAAAFQELYRPFADGFPDLHSRTVEAMYVMSVGLAALFAFLGYRLRRRIPHAAAFIGVGIGLYAGVRTSIFIDDWYSPYATSEHDLFMIQSASILGSGLLWAVVLATSGYVLGRRLERRLEPAAPPPGRDLTAP